MKYDHNSCLMNMNDIVNLKITEKLVRKYLKNCNHENPILNEIFMADLYRLLGLIQSTINSIDYETILITEDNQYNFDKSIESGRYITHDNEGNIIINYDWKAEVGDYVIYTKDNNKLCILSESDYKELFINIPNNDEVNFKGITFNMNKG